MDHRFQASPSQILLEAMQDCEERKVSKVIVLCFDQKGEPLGYLTNESSSMARLGMVEAMKFMMLTDEIEEDDLPSGSRPAQA